MKLDERRPYGIVHGDPQLKYFQDNKHFDQNMDMVEESDIRTPERTAPMADSALNSAKQFLLNVLRGGPVSKANVYRATEDATLKWADVKEAAVQMRIRIAMVSKVEQWSIDESTIVN